MADFNTYPSLQLQNPDMLGGYLKGMMGGQELQLGQQRLALGGQELQKGALSMDQLRMAIEFQKMRMGFMGDILGQIGGGNGETSGQGAPSMGRTGGIQNGPQDAMGGTATSRGGALQGNPSQAGGYGGGFDTGQANLDPKTRLALGILDPEMAKGLAESEASNLKKAQLQAQPTLDLADNAISSDHPERLIMNNPGTYGAAYRQFAPQLGLDPSDPASLTPENARRVAVLFKNHIAGQVGLPSTPMPAEVTPVAGAAGQLLGVTHGGTGPQGAIAEIAGQKLPGYSIEKRFNAATGKMEGVPVMTSPGGSAAPMAALMGAGAGGGGGVARSPSVLRTAAGLGPAAGGGVRPAPAPAGAGGIGSQVAPTVDLGSPEITGMQPDTARRAQDFASGWSTVRGLESQNVGLSTAQRVALTQSIVGAGGIFGAHEALQKYFLQAKLSPDQKQYVTAILPMVAARSYEEGGRFNEQKFRESMEAMVPANVKDSQDLSQVNQFRANTQKSLDVGSGSVGAAPGFADIAARRASGSATTPKTVTQANVQDYASKHGLSYQAALKHVTASGYTLK